MTNVEEETSEAEERQAEEPQAAVGESRARRIAEAWAGPILIALSVIFAMRGFLFRSFITDQHPDILSMWLPRNCFLGSSLVAGHVPLWNPFQFSGAPYASDAQSGWLYLPVMTLFSALPCGAAMRAFIAFNPLLGGLGLYWFLRKEGLYRTPTTAAGLSYAMIMSTSTIAISLPFAGSLAWTPLVLVGASGWMRAETWPRRLLWLGLGGLAFGQVAAAHMSHGLLMCAGLTLAYLIARAARSVHFKHEKPLRPVLMALGYFAFLLPANIAILLPHLAMVGRTSLRGGYAALGVQIAEAAGINDAPLPDGGVWSGWPFALASAPGAFAGATILLSIPLALRTHGKRYLAAAFAAAGFGAWVLTLNVLVGAPWFRNFVLSMPFGDVYLHNPGRFRYLLFLIAPVLGALGIQGLIERPMKAKPALLWMGAALIIFSAIPVTLGAHPVRFLLFLVGAVAAVPALVGLAGRKKWACVAVPLVLAVELAASALYSQAYQGGTVFLGLESAEQDNLIAGPLRWPEVSVKGYMTPGTIAQKLQQQPDRYYTWAPPAAYFQKGYLFTQDERYWPALENGRSMLFGVHDTMGYSPIQPSRYWSYIRATNRLPIFYNASLLQEPSLTDLRLLGARYLIVPNNATPTVDAQKVMSEGGFSLYSVDGWEPRTSVVPDWTVLPDPTNALSQVMEKTFDPGTRAIVEQDPGIEPTAGGLPGQSVYNEKWPEDVSVSVRAPSPSLLVVRNSYDPGWSATVDGKPAPLLHADWFLQAVPVPLGDHEVRLVYRDPTIAQGLAGSAAVWGAWLICLLGSTFVRRRRLRRGAVVEGSPEGSPEESA